MHHVPPSRGPGQPLARYFGKYFWKVLCTFLQKYFVLRTVSCIRQFRPVSCVRALRSCNSPCLMFSSSPRTVASGKRGGHPSNRAPPTPDADGLAAVLAATPTVAERARETVERTAQVIGSRFLFCFWFKLRLHDEIHIYLTE